jgi:hypothetical protein
MYHISLITTKGNQKNIGMTVLLFQCLATFEVPTGLRGTAARQEPDENSGHNSAGEYAQRIAFGHRLKLRRERRDLVGGRLSHVAGCCGGLADDSLASVYSIAHSVLHGINGVRDRLARLRGSECRGAFVRLELVFMKFS